MRVQLDQCPAGRVRGRRLVGRAVDVADGVAVQGGGRRVVHVQRDRAVQRALRPARPQIQDDVGRIRHLLADDRGRVQPAQAVLTGDRVGVPDVHGADEPRQTVPPVSRTPRRVSVGHVFLVLLLAKLEHVPDRERFRQPVFRGVRDVPGHQRRPERTEGRAHRPRQVSVPRDNRGGPAAGRRAATARGRLRQRFLQPR